MSVEHLNTYRIILASKSPRRYDLLKGLGLNFEVDVESGVSENFPPDLKAADIAAYLAEQKSNAYRKTLSDKDILITADTVVWLSDRLLGKPANPSEARDMLLELSGNTHEVFTGVCIRSATRRKTFVSVTSVTFSELSDEEIRYYVEKYKPFDKAGAYGIQEWIGYIAVESINGSYFNVIGLPVQRLYRELMAFISK